MCRRSLLHQHMRRLWFLKKAEAPSFFHVPGILTSLRCGSRRRCRVLCFRRGRTEPFLWQSVHSTCELRRRSSLPEPHREFFCARVSRLMSHSKDGMRRLDDSHLRLEHIAFKWGRTRHPSRSANSEPWIRAGCLPGSNILMGLCVWEKQASFPSDDALGAYHVTALGESAWGRGGEGLWGFSNVCLRSISRTCCFIIHIWGNIFMYPMHIRNANVPR